MTASDFAPRFVATEHGSSAITGRVSSRFLGDRPLECGGVPPCVELVRSNRVTSAIFERSFYRDFATSP
jgi:hypothetical protein